MTYSLQSMIKHLATEARKNLEQNWALGVKEQGREERETQITTTMTIITITTT